MLIHTKYYMHFTLSENMSEYFYNLEGIKTSKYHLKLRSHTENIC